jgi:hypothetical protein
MLTDYIYIYTYVNREKNEIIYKYIIIVYFVSSQLLRESESDVFV